MVLIGLSWLCSMAPHQAHGKYNGVLAQIMDVYSAADDNNYRRQKVYRNYGFAKATLILACDATKEAEEEMVDAITSKEDATTLKEYTKKTH